MCEFRLLGPVEVVHGGRTLPIGAPKQRCVLARLLLDPGTPVPNERIYAAVWGDDLPDAARKAVQVYVSNLRRALAGVPGLRIRTTPGGYLIDLDPRRVDLHRFRALAEREHDPEAWTRALGLWRGEPFGGLGDCALRHTEGVRLTEERLRLAERYAEAELAAGRAGTLIPTLYDLVASQPLRETAYALLMRALAADGRLGEALAVYADVRELLLDRLGTEPSPALTQVHEQLLHAHAGPAGPNALAYPAEDPGAGPPTLVPAQLPPRLTELTGRRTELAELLGLLSAPPPDRVLLAAISGYGGIGKSTLALAAAHAVADRFDGGQLFADLGGARATPADPADVLAGFLLAYGVQGDRIPDRMEDRTALFRSVTASRRVLIVLDDAADADSVRALLPGSAGSAVLVTSRARLPGLDGVRPLALRELTDTEALALLAGQIGAERVRAEPDAAARIVRRCGGVPLAVRIAGGRLSRPSWTLTALAERLDEADPLDELYDGDLEVRASFDLSYRRLAPGAARAFRMLAVVGAAGVGRFTADAAAAALDLPERRLRRVLDGLVDLHLLEEPEPGRYRYHELLRGFAVEHCERSDPPGERTAVLRRAFDRYAGDAMDALNAMLPGLGLPVWPGERTGFAGSEDATDWLAAEHVAVTDLALRVLDSLDPLPGGGGGVGGGGSVGGGSVGGGPVGGGGPGADVNAGGGELPLLERIASITLSLGNYAEICGAWPGREEVAERVLLLGERGGWGAVANRARTVLAGIALRRGDQDSAIARLEAVLADARDRDDTMTCGRILAMLGVAEREAGRLDRSARRLREALRAHRSIGYARGYASSLIHLADLWNRAGDHAAAGRCALAALRIEAGMRPSDPYLTMSAAHALGDAQAANGREAEARTWYRRALELASAHGSGTTRRQVLPKLAKLA